jgi:tetratricopeptide (TPR) repeat protein
MVSGEIMVAHPDFPHFTLDLLQAHVTDYVWLAGNYDGICAQVQDELRIPGVVSIALKKLDVIIHYVISREDLDRWRKPLYDALLVTMNAGDEEQQMRVWSQLGSIYLRSGNYRSATQTLDKVLEMPDTEMTHEAMLLARIGLLGLRGIQHAEDLDTFIQDTLVAAEHCKPELRARLHTTLGQAYLHRGHTVEAISYLQDAYVKWRQLGNLAEQERNLLSLAEASWVAFRYEQSSRYLSFLSEGLSDSFSTAARRYHQGVAFLETGRLGEAEQVLKQALSYFEKLDAPFLVMSAHHTLGLVQTNCGKYAEAHDNLSLALAFWQESGNRYQHVNAIYALAYLFHREGDFESAYSLYHDALRLLARVPVSPIVVALRDCINEDLSELSK